MEQVTADVLVVGGGPGGYVAAIRCGQLGLGTVLVDKEGLGGTCLIRGCIPSKALIHAAGQFEAMAIAAEAGRWGISLPGAPVLDMAKTVAWKNGIVEKLNGGVAALLRRANVRHIRGWARFSDAKTCGIETETGKIAVSAKHVILATGSVPVELPALPFGGRVITSSEALSLSAVPRHLVVVGAGYIGLELGTAYRNLGAEVTVVEQQPRILPHYGKDLVEPVRRALERKGIRVHLGARATRFDGDAGAVEIETAAGEVHSVPADYVLVTVGRRPATAGWGLDQMAVAMNGPWVRVDERCATSTRDVWAIGDLVGEPMLAHKASAQGEMVAEIIAGHRRRFDPVAIPAVCYTEPEIVSVGLDADEPGDQEVDVAIFPLQANGRALILGAEEDRGFIRIVSDKGDGRVLGVQAVGRHVGELAGEFSLAVEMGALLDDVAGTIHAHPTLGEAFHEASLKGLGRAIHI